MGSIYKKLPITNQIGTTKMVSEKIMDIDRGCIFGEDTFFHNRPNNFTVVSNSPILCYEIKIENIKSNFKKLIPHLGEFFNKKRQFFEDRINFLIRSR